MVWSHSGEPAQNVDPGKAYRLVTGGGQLVPGRHGLGVQLLHVAQGRSNVRFERAVHDPNYGEAINVGRYLRLNEPLAIRVSGGGYLMFVGGESLGLAWKDNSGFRLEDAPGKYQWQLRRVPRANVRDHRPPRDVTTQEDLGLYNVVANRFLIYSPRDPRLRWLEQ